MDEVLEQHPGDIILPEELPVKGIGAAVSGARSARFLDPMRRGNWGMGIMSPIFFPHFLTRSPICFIILNR
jgi:hypothetical protein